MAANNRSATPSHSLDLRRGDGARPPLAGVAHTLCWVGLVLSAGCSSRGRGNQAPVAGADTFTVPRNGSITVSGLLANDSDAEADALALVSVAAPSKGSLVNNGGGSYTYTANTNAFGADTFDYVIADARGNQATGTITVNISPGWGSAAVISSATAAPSAPQIAADDAGNLTVLWTQQGGAGFQDLWVNRLSAAAGWGTAVKLDTVETDDVTNAKLVADGDGDVTVVWQQDDAGVDSVWAARWSAGAWSAAAGIDLSGNAASAPELAIDGLGRITVLYRQADAEVNLYAQHYVPGQGWKAPEQIDNSTAPVTAHSCATDAANNVTATCLHDGGSADMWANHCTPGTGWGTARKVELEDLGAAQLASIHPDATGNVTLLWRQDDGTRVNAWSTRFTLGSGWVNGNKIEAQAGAVGAGTPVAVVDATGRTTALIIADVGGTDRLFQTQDPGTGTWSGETRLDTGVGAVGAVQALVDTASNVHVVWTQMGATHIDLWAAMYSPGVGWSVPAVIDSENLGSVGSFVARVDADNNVVVAWSQADATVVNCWANRYESGVGWGVAARIEAGAGAVTTLGDLRVQAAGVAVATWTQQVGATAQQFAARFAPATGWSTEVQVDSGLAATGNTPLCTVDAAGNATVCWTQGNDVYSIDFR